LENLVDEAEEECVTHCENVRIDAQTQTDEIQKDIDTALRQQLADLKSELEKAHRRIEALQNQLFSVERCQNNSSAINFYTGFTSCDVCMAVFKYLNPGDKGENINCWLSSKSNVSSDVNDEDGTSENKRGRSRSRKRTMNFSL